MFFTTGTVNTEDAKGTSQALTVDSVTTFSLNFSASARIAYVELTPVSGGDQSTVTHSQNGGLSGYSGTSADDGRPKITVSIEDKHDFFSVVQIVLGVLLVILTLVGVVSIVRHNRKKNNFDWTDFDDFDDYC